MPALTERQKAQRRRRRYEKRLVESMERGERTGRLTKGRTTLHELGHLWFLWKLIECIDTFIKITIVKDAEGNEGAVHYTEAPSYTRRQLKAKLRMIGAVHRSTALHTQAIEGKTPNVHWWQSSGGGFFLEMRRRWHGQGGDWERLAKKLADTSPRWARMRQTPKNYELLRKSFIDKALISMAVKVMMNRTMFRPEVQELFGHPEMSCRCAGPKEQKQCQPGR
ncbi:hypothetical protein niasHT_039139 [Heterodera trifolii]|uniref:Uncharacterized protein n=1 Tax=Heterodera trifolii TaxID=157864 RepID=A0ABD2HZA7_9BILA